MSNVIVDKLDAQINKYEKLKKQKRSHYYIWYLLFILSLIYIVDELASNLQNNLQVEMASSIFKDIFFNDNIYKATNKFSLVNGIATIVLVFSMFYKPLADKYGRKLFLVLNTIGIGCAVLLCSFARTQQTFYLYWIGFFLLRFFVTPDEQVVYIIETVKNNNRAKTLGIIKGISEIFLVLISLLKMSFIGGNISGSNINSNGNNKWYYVFLVISIMCFTASFIALFFAKETQPFIQNKLDYLYKQKEGVIEKPKEKVGFINSLKITFKNKTILFLFIATLLYSSASGIINYYQTLFTSHRLSYYSSSDTSYTNEQILIVFGEMNRLLFVFPFTCGIVTIIYGFISDKVGRKKITVGLLSISLFFFTLYMILVIFAKPNVTLDYFLGAIIGIFLGTYWSGGDSYIMMAGESAKTNNRVSMMTAQSLFFGVGQLMSTIYTLIIPVFGGNGINDILKGLYCIFVTGGCFSSSLFLLLFFVPETHKNKITTENNVTLNN